MHGGFRELLAEVDRQLAAGFRRVRLSIPHDQAGVLARLRRTGRILSQEYVNDSILVEAEVDSALERAVEPYLVPEAP
ncbi:MAG: hypothetical protein NTU83_07200 [Candidatus Hydrogenedentes bacterium]|nr:hypothetical protein [Candidatus Hydrogenedentota bacterium]